MSDYLASPTLQGMRQRVYRQGVAAGKRAGTPGKDIAYERWQRRWYGKAELLASQDWLDGFNDGVA